LWEPLDDWHVLQQVELRASPLIVTEHRFRRYRHKNTPGGGRIIHAPVPDDLQQQGMFGPRLRALTATLKGDLHASYRGMTRLYEDAFGLAISTGYLGKVVAQTSDALALPYDRLCAALPGEPVLNLDETGHPDRGDRLWLWGAVAKRFTVFKVAAHRSAKVIEGLLGLAYAGVVGCDFFGAYRKFLKDTAAAPGGGGGGASAAFCWAHLIRDVRFLTTLSDKAIVRWAMKLLNAIKQLFKAYHTQGQRAQQEAKSLVLKCVRRPPNRGETRTLAKRIREHAKAYFLFLERDDVEPTNNAAERALRHAVISRKLTQGTRGDTGQRWCERMLSVRATCQQQRRSFFNYLVAAITEHTHRREPPPLLA
jgi:transposase